MSKNTSNNKKMDYQKEIENLKNRVSELEKNLNQHNRHSKNNQSSDKADNTNEPKQQNQKPKETSDSKNHDSKNSSNSKQGSLPKNAKNIEALVTSNLDIVLTKDKTKVDVEEKDIVTNQLVMGDDILIDTKNGKVDKLKVARRAKREIVEGLVTSKDDNLYAVTKFGVHKMFAYDVQTKGVYKGFEVNVILPKDKEGEATAAIIKDIESTGDVDISNDKNITKAPTYDPRVVEDDDLV